MAPYINITKPFRLYSGCTTQLYKINSLQFPFSSRLKILGRQVPHATNFPEDFSLNLGGAAKGYALDRAKNILKKYGINSALIEAGGDVLLVGKKKRKDNWLIGIRNPRGRNEIIGTLLVSDCFVFTSGDYERYFEIEGVRYHHIVDPSTGYPSREISSATVIVKDGIEGDCITTALVAMGIEKATKYINDNKVEAILVDTAKNIHKFIENTKISIYE